MLSVHSSAPSATRILVPAKDTVRQFVPGSMTARRVAGTDTSLASCGDLIGEVGRSQEAEY